MNQFSQNFAVEKGLVLKYLQHLTYLKTKKDKRQKEQREKAEREKTLVYEDFDWLQLARDDILKRQRASVLDLNVNRHNLSKKKLSKSQKVAVVTAHIQMCATLNLGEKDRNKESEAESATTITDSNSDEDLVLEEIGRSSSEEDNLPLSVLVSQSRACRGTDGESDSDVPLSTLQSI